MKSFKPKQPPSDQDGDPPGDRNVSADFRGEKRSNDTHRSTTDPDARLYRKRSGMEAILCFIGHGLMENRSGLLVDARLTRVSGRRSAIDRRTTRHPGYAASQRIRRIKSVAGLRQTKLRGRAKVDWAFTFAAAAYDLVRLPKLIGSAA